MKKVRLINAENLKLNITKDFKGMYRIPFTVNDKIDSEPDARCFRLNSNHKVVESVITAIINKNGHCPCQIDQTEDTLCPCVDFYKGECHCKLFVRIDKEN